MTSFYVCDPLVLNNKAGILDQVFLAEDGAWTVTQKVVNHNGKVVYDATNALDIDTAEAVIIADKSLISEGKENYWAEIECDKAPHFAHVSGNSLAISQGNFKFRRVLNKFLQATGNGWYKLHRGHIVNIQNSRKVHITKNLYREILNTTEEEWGNILLSWDGLTLKASDKMKLYGIR